MQPQQELGEISAKQWCQIRVTEGWLQELLNCHNETYSTLCSFRLCSHGVKQVENVRRSPQWSAVQTTLIGRTACSSFSGLAGRRAANSPDGRAAPPSPWRLLLTDHRKSDTPVPTSCSCLMY